METIEERVKRLQKLEVVSVEIADNPVKREEILSDLLRKIGKHEVKVDSRKLRLFEMTFRKVRSRESVFKYLDGLLEETKGAKFCAIDGEHIIHTNPSDEVVCAEAIAREIRQCDMSRAKETTRDLFIEYVKAWLEDVESRNENTEDGEASAPNYDYSRIKAMFENPNIGKKFVDKLAKILQQNFEGLDIGILAARTFEKHYINSIKREWGTWKAFWGEVRAALNIPSNQFDYRKSKLIKIYKDMKKL